ncbi:MAG: hypothetical protein QOK42_1583 [Frankiaceae bacterium]|jgi:peptidoglycan/LPS O-acetylase OafA/YrhL|nr:hypothetical protein [Frankiaceae bacterium]
MWQRLLRRRPTVWSPKGRVLYGLIVVGMFAVSRWWAPGALGGFVMVPLMAGAMLVLASEQRQRARRYHKDNDE